MGIWVKSLDAISPVVSVFLAMLVVVPVYGGTDGTGLFDVQVFGLEREFAQGETRHITIHLTNTGSTEESYEVALELSDPSWRGSLDRTVIPDMAPGETRPLNLTLVAPAGPPGDGTYINLTVGTQPMATSNTSDLKVLSIWVQEEAMEEEPYYEIYGLPTAVMLGSLLLLALVINHVRKGRMA